ncbi:response regulator [Dongia mobilis]|jgi:CheY-like chemotaxis protein|uniref:response regulator n=1 Tax=Dongia sp. TaxID=1977262 RepID=UPI0026ED2A0A
MAHVLLIDDDELVRDMLQTALQLAGHDVTPAGNGREGLEKFAERRPDIVVTDIIMPEQEGIETILAIRRIDQALPIIAMSGGSSLGAVDFLNAARSFGASRVLNKPFSPKDLIAALKDCLVTG